MKKKFKARNINVEPMFRIALEYGNPPISNASFKAVDSSVSWNEKKMFKIC
jgi:hypothetical protein